MEGFRQVRCDWEVATRHTRTHSVVTGQGGRIGHIWGGCDATHTHKAHSTPWSHCPSADAVSLDQTSCPQHTPPPHTPHHTTTHTLSSLLPIAVLARPMMPYRLKEAEPSRRWGSTLRARHAAASSRMYLQMYPTRVWGREGGARWGCAVMMSIMAATFTSPPLSLRMLSCATAPQTSLGVPPDLCLLVYPPPHPAATHTHTHIRPPTHHHQHAHTHPSPRPPAGLSPPLLSTHLPGS